MATEAICIVSQGFLTCQKLSIFTVQVNVTGYAYNMRGAPIILSCMVLLSYTISVGVPSVFIHMKGLSSNSGDGMSEVTALAIESQPMEALKNMCGGLFKPLLTTMFSIASYDRAGRSGCLGMGVLMFRDSFI